MRSLLILFFVICAPLLAETSKEPPGVGITDKRNTDIPLDLIFTDEDGKARKLGEFFDGKRPVILAPAYYNCPRLCTLVYNGLRDAISAVSGSMIPGRDYRVVSFSINPLDNAEITRKKASNYRESIQNLKVDSAGWTFLRGDAKTIQKLTDSVGYRYKTDGPTDFSHPAAIILLTPNGKIARYMLGIEFPVTSFRLSLVEASLGRLGGPVDGAMLFCFRYDDEQGKYTPVAWAFMRIAAALVLATLVGLIFFMLVTEKSRNR